MIEWSERKAYWRHTKVQMLTSLLPFVVSLIVLPLYADALNGKRVLGIPLGYFLACHGLLIIALRHRGGVRQPPGRHRSLARRARRHLSAMAFTARTRLVNPRLGTYFGIFAAAFASLVLMALMFEQLGTSDLAVRLLMFAGPYRPVRGDRPAGGGARGRRLFRLRPQGAGLLQRAGARPSARLAAPASWP